MGEFLSGLVRPSSYTPGRCKSPSTRNSSRIFLYPDKTSPSPGRFPAADSARAMPPVWPLAPEPKVSASRRATDFSGASRLSHAAAASPVKPPPTMAKSTVSGRGWGIARKFTVQGRLPQFLSFVSGSDPWADTLELSEQHKLARSGELRLSFI